jgi:thiosulfate dehydrogenase [quinone] large subunit
VTRISLGFVFLWAFVDKTFGLGFATPAERAWTNGGSPTTGFLKGAEGTFAGFFNNLAGSVFVDWLFMLGLLGIGLGLTLGIAMRITAACTTVLLGMMWLAALPLENNPVIDDHLIYAMVAIALAASNAGHTLGLGAAWTRIPLVEQHRALR